MMGLESDSVECQHLLIVHEAGRRWVDALRGMAHGSGWQVRHCTSIRDTLAEVCTEQPVTLLVELGRQPLEALHLVEQLSGLGKELPVIVLARADQADLEVAARELGASAFLREPLTGAELVRMVRAIVRLQLSTAQSRGV